MQWISDLKIPAIAAPMFLISGPQLVIECCKAGIVGTFPALNQRTTAGFEEWVIQIKEELGAWERSTGKKAAPFGVNLIVHHSNPRVEADLKICVKHQVPLVITSLGAVSELVSAVHSYGGKVFHDIIKKRHAEKAAEAQVDGLILVCAGAGGHAGTLNPIPMVHEIKSFYDGTVILSGGISTGGDIASALQMGADLAYMGTRFIATEESLADQAYRQMIIEASTSDIIYTPAVSGVNANFLKNSLQKAGIGPELWNKAGKVDFGKEMDEAQSEAKAWKTIWSAGQGAAVIDEVLPAQKLIAQLHKEMIKAMMDQKNRLEFYTSRSEQE